MEALARETFQMMVRRIGFAAAVASPSSYHVSGALCHSEDAAAVSAQPRWRTLTDWRSGVPDCWLGGWWEWRWGGCGAMRAVRRSGAL